MKQQKKILSKETCSRFNAARLDYSRTQATLNRVETMDTIRLIFDMRPTDGMLASLVKHGCLVRVDRGRYAFPKDPVHYDKLNLAYQGRNDLQNRPRTLKHQDLTVETAIEFLKKQKHYRVFKATLSLNRALENKDKTARELIEWVEL